MKKIICTVCFSMAVLLNGNANAAYSILIDNSDQDNVFSLYFVTDEYAVVAGYQLDFAYDDTEMSYVGYTNDVPSVGIIPDMFGAPDGTTPGIINNFNAFTFFGSPYYAEAGSTTLIGTLTFSINDGAIADGERDLWMNLTVNAGVGFGEPQHETFYLFRDYPDTVTYGLGLDVGDPPAPVPVPGTLGLVAVGLVGLAGITRRRDDV